MAVPRGVAPPDRPADPVRGVLLDIDGVIVQSWEPIPGAVEAVAALQRHLPVRFVTNTTSRSAAEIAGALRACGVDLADDHLISAGVATAHLIDREHPGARCLLLDDSPTADLAGLNAVGPHDPTAEDVDVVVVGGGGPALDWHAANAAARALLRGASLVAMHGSMVWATADGVCVDTGAYAAMLEAATGTRATIVGKPAAALFDAALESMGVVAGDAVMVGDDLASDVLAAQALGMTGVLVRTGKFDEQTLARAAERPDVVVDSLADVPALLGL